MVRMYLSNHATTMTNNNTLHWRESHILEGLSLFVSHLVFLSAEYSGDNPVPCCSEVEGVRLSMLGL